MKNGVEFRRLIRIPSWPELNRHLTFMRRPASKSYMPCYLLYMSDHNTREVNAYLE